jgi:hypothetical protein
MVMAVIFPPVTAKQRLVLRAGPAPGSCGFGRLRAGRLLGP